MNWDDTFWVLDLEGNGATPPEMVELALVEVRALVPTGRSRHWLIRPETPISHFATRIHGIRNKDLAGAPGFDDIADDVLTLIEGAAIVGHNVRVDLDVLQRALPGWEPSAAIDTMRIARSVRPGLPSYALGKLAASLAIVVEGMEGDRVTAHSAPYDAKLTGMLFSNLLMSVAPDARSALVDDANIIAVRQGLLL